MNTSVRVVLAAVVVLAACGGPTDANDSLQVREVPRAVTTTTSDASGTAPAVPRRAAPGELDPVNETEWNLIGTWTVESIDDDATGVVATAVGDTCDFGDDHELRCSGGNWSVDATWLADPMPWLDGDDGTRAMLTWLADDGARGGSARITLDGDRLTITSGFDGSVWVRSAMLARPEQPSATSTRLESAMTGVWELTEIIDESSTLLDQLSVGSRCRLMAGGAFSCTDAGAGLDGRWWLQRGIGGDQPGGVAPRLALTTDDGYSVGTTFVLDGTDHLDLVGTAASSWVRVA